MGYIKVSHQLEVLTEAAKRPSLWVGVGPAMEVGEDCELGPVRVHVSLVGSPHPLHSGCSRDLTQLPKLV